MTQPSPSDDGADPAARVEHRWAALSVVVLVLLVVMATFAALHLAAMPQSPRRDRRSTNLASRR